MLAPMEFRVYFASPEPQSGITWMTPMFASAQHTESTGIVTSSPQQALSRPSLMSSDSAPADNVHGAQAPAFFNLLLNIMQQQALQNRMLERFLQEAMQSGPKGTPPASEKAINTLKKCSIADTSNPCTVCHETFNVGETATFLPCGHAYHGDCIVPWLKAHNSCPLCRFELETDDEQYNKTLANKNQHIPLNKEDFSPNAALKDGVFIEDISDRDPDILTSSYEERQRQRQRQC